jgi:hypothetical protein
MSGGSLFTLKGLTQRPRSDRSTNATDRRKATAAMPPLRSATTAVGGADEWDADEWDADE